MREISKKRPLFLKAFLPLFFLVFVVAFKPARDSLKSLFSLFQQMDVEVIKNYILSFGIWAPVVSFSLMVFQSIVAPLPAFLITFANAALFGWKYGALLSWASAMAGAALCFFIARLYGRTTVEKMTSKAGLESVDGFFEKYGKYAVLVARLIPCVSFDIVSYGAGLTSMGFWAFTLATGVGQLPATIVYSYAGGVLTGSVRNIVFFLSFLFAATVLVAAFKKIRDDRRACS